MSSYPLSSMSTPMQAASSVIGGSSSWFSMRTVYIVLFSIVLLGVAYYIISPYFGSSEHSGDGNTKGKAKGNAEIILFYADWCPHCKTAKPEWDDAKAKWNGQQINGAKITFTEHEGTNPNADLEEKMTQMGIEEFPTVKLLYGGQIIDFDAKITQDSISQFLHEVIQ